jgi:predicted nuclease of predicted toxin-antitoxin system
MRFLADESCDFRVVRALRAAGHDVVSIIEAAPGAEDARVIDLAAREQRILIAEDQDFGQLVYATGRPTAGVILLRFVATARVGLPALVVDMAARHGDKLAGRFVVIQPGRIRFGGSQRS